jgi:hypothetical protein
MSFPDVFGPREKRRSSGLVPPSPARICPNRWSERISPGAVTQPYEARRGPIAYRWRPSQKPPGGAQGMHSIFYIIGVVVVVLAILSFLGFG